MRHYGVLTVRVGFQVRQEPGVRLDVAVRRLEPGTLVVYREERSRPNSRTERKPYTLLAPNYYCDVIPVDYPDCTPTFVDGNQMRAISGIEALARQAT